MLPVVSNVEFEKKEILSKKGVAVISRKKMRFFLFCLSLNNITCITHTHTQRVKGQFCLHLLFATVFVVVVDKLD